MSKESRLTKTKNARATLYLAATAMLVMAISAGCARHVSRGISESETSGPAARRSVLPTSTLFDFGEYDISDLKPGGREQIARLASELRQAKDVRQVRVIGHTDMFGSDQLNQGLSQRRADTVRQLLIDDGVPAAWVSAEGRGDKEPVKRCDRSLARNVLIACLQPNRRVEIVTDLTHSDD